MFGLPLGALILFGVTLLVAFGVAERVLDRMRLTDRQALLILVLLIVGSFLPAIRITPYYALDIGGAVVPLGVAIYLIATAGTGKERVRAIIAAIVTGAAIFAAETFIPGDAGLRGFVIDIDPVWLPAIIAAIVGYIAGRSRRSAFIAGISGVVLADIGAGIQNIVAGRVGSTVVIGGAGALDAVVIGGVLAVVLAEIFGELREYLQGGPSQDRPEGLKRGLTNKNRPDHGEPNIVKAKRAEHRDWKTSPVTGAVAAAALLLALLVGGRYFGRGEANDGRVYTIMTEDGQELTTCGFTVTAGDQYLDVDNILYRVYSVKGSDAWAKPMRRVDLTAEIESLRQQALAAGETWDVDLATLTSFAPPNVAIYSTHSDESYKPASGRSAVNAGQGDVYRVGAAFAAQLKADGMTPIQSGATHYPHNSGAYRRSRGTLTSLLKTYQPVATFDVHRDAGPAKTYAGKVAGEDLVQLRFVVGRQNPNINQNRAFAMQLKKVADSMYPGLVKGIYYAKGGYNQDIFPRAMLIECGTENSTLSGVQKGVQKFADVVAKAFGTKK